MRSRPFIPETREVELAQWTHVMTLSSTGMCFIEASSQVTKEWANTPRWRWLKRKRLDREADLIYRLAEVVADYEGRQREATA